MPRPKGSKNRISSTVKDNIVRVFEDVGGWKAMAKWARANPDQFYTFYSRLAPKEIVADVESDLTVQLVSYADSPAPDDSAA